MPQLFTEGDKFTTLYKGYFHEGTVIRLRNDEYERKECWIDDIYHYSVVFEDGSSESYLSQTYMEKI